MYAKWARDVVTPWLDRGWRVAMWADIVNSHPEALDIIPDEVLLIPWTYESPRWKPSSLTRKVTRFVLMPDSRPPPVSLPMLVGRS